MYVKNLGGTVYQLTPKRILKSIFFGSFVCGFLVALLIALTAVVLADEPLRSLGGLKGVIRLGWQFTWYFLVAVVVYASIPWFLLHYFGWRNWYFFSATAVLVPAILVMARGSETPVFSTPTFVTLTFFAFSGFVYWRIAYRKALAA